MLKTALHRLVARPAVYDAVQRLAGSGQIARRLAARLPERALAGRVLDLGGGTGISRPLWPADCTYICLDLELQKLEGFRRNHPHDPALLADATRLPFPAAALDAILCKQVSHHLPDPAWAALLDESARVLRPGGLFIFVDAVWAPRRLPGRLLWSLDRGANPRRPAALHAALRRRFTIRHWEQFAIYHTYVLALAVKPAAPGEPS
jgi:SAM-dependent methyltransferase